MCLSSILPAQSSPVCHLLRVSVEPQDDEDDHLDEWESKADPATVPVIKTGTPQPVLEESHSPRHESHAGEVAISEGRGNILELSELPTGTAESDDMAASVTSGGSLDDASKTSTPSGDLVIPRTVIHADSTSDEKIAGSPESPVESISKSRPIPMSPTSSLIPKLSEQDIENRVASRSAVEAASSAGGSYNYNKPSCKGFDLLNCLGMGPLVRLGEVNGSQGPPLYSTVEGLIISGRGLSLVQQRHSG